MEYRGRNGGCPYPKSTPAGDGPETIWWCNAADVWGLPPATEAGPSAAPTSAAPDLDALMMMLQKQARRQEEQARRLEEQLRGGQDEQARRLEEQMLVIKDLHATFGK
ncbi:unnamed protein product [Parnassius apollo]|uniref:(apollo) hypothetical protein n=1 Tax=Parnassius apollo TaxID=110799 RepID=A0A8S3XLF1_PARAO|nr:unnamed protein product [Parnassius apollo]